MSKPEFGQPLTGPEKHALNCAARHARQDAAAAAMARSRAQYCQLLYSARIKLGAARISQALMLAWSSGQLPLQQTSPLVPMAPDKQQLLQMIADGHTYREMAEQLDITPSILGGRMRTLYNQMGAHGRIHAVYLGITSGHLTTETPAAPEAPERTPAARAAG